MRESSDRRGLLNKNKTELKKIIEDEHKKYKAKIKLELDSIDINEDNHKIEEISNGDNEQLLTSRQTPRRNILEDIQDEDEKEELEKEMFLSLPASRPSKRKDKSKTTRNIRRNMDAQLFICQMCSKFVF